jgi:hypothetical protein
MKTQNDNRPWTLCTQALPPEGKEVTGKWTTGRGDFTHVEERTIIRRPDCYIGLYAEKWQTCSVPHEWQHKAESQPPAQPLSPGGGHICHIDNDGRITVLSDVAHLATASTVTDDEILKTLQWNSIPFDEKGIPVLRAIFARDTAAAKQTNREIEYELSCLRLVCEQHTEEAAKWRADSKENLNIAVNAQLLREAAETALTAAREQIERLTRLNEVANMMVAERDVERDAAREQIEKITREKDEALRPMERDNRHAVSAEIATQAVTVERDRLIAANKAKREAPKDWPTVEELDKIWSASKGYTSGLESFIDLFTARHNAAVAVLHEERENWRMSSVCRENDARLTEAGKLIAEAAPALQVATIACRATTCEATMASLNATLAKLQAYGR